MFRDMQAANMEVHMSQTEGEREKCVDIALAVEMLHYATVPGAYDLAVCKYSRQRHTMIITLVEFGAHT
jgi:hypothetical protein